MDDRTRSRQQRLIWHVIHRDHTLRKRTRQIAFVANQQHRPPADASCSLDAFVKEITRNPNSRRAQRKNYRRCATVQKTNQLSWNNRFMMTIVETEPRNRRLLRPIRLPLCKDFREQRQHASWRVLALKHRIPDVWQSEFVAKIRDSLRLVHALRKVEQEAHHFRTKNAEPSRPLPKWRDRRVVRRDER